jgi:HPr kinase/phosphorylase
MEIERLPGLLRIDPGLELVAGAGGLGRRIHAPAALHAGLASTGSATPPTGPGRVLLLGRPGIDYLSACQPVTRERAATRLVEGEPPGVVVADGMTPPGELLAATESRAVPLFVTGSSLLAVAGAIRDALAGHLTEIRSVHGVLLDVYGVGVLLLGPSGLGKSEAGLELVLRGHRLVADDVVDLALHPPATVIGSGNEILRHGMEIRGLGIIDVRDLFGIASVRETKRVELVVQLEEWQPGKHYERLGLDERTHELLGVELPLVVLPIGPGRSLSAIVEVAARSRLLKWMGHDSADDFERRRGRGSPRDVAADDREEDLE